MASKVDKGRPTADHWCSLRLVVDNSGVYCQKFSEIYWLPSQIRKTSLRTNDIVIWSA